MLTMGYNIITSAVNALFCSVNKQSTASKG